MPWLERHPRRMDTGRTVPDQGGVIGKDIQRERSLDRRPVATSVATSSCAVDFPLVISFRLYTAMRQPPEPMQGADIPFTPGAERMFHERGCWSFWVSSRTGGVICAAMEYRGARESQAMQVIVRGFASIPRPCSTGLRAPGSCRDKRLRSSPKSAYETPCDSGGSA